MKYDIKTFKDKFDNNNKVAHEILDDIEKCNTINTNNNLETKIHKTKRNLGIIFFGIVIIMIILLAFLILTDAEKNTLLFVVLMSLFLILTMLGVILGDNNPPDIIDFLFKIEKIDDDKIDFLNSVLERPIDKPKEYIPIFFENGIYFYKYNNKMHIIREDMISKHEITPSNYMDYAMTKVNIHKVVWDDDKCIYYIESKCVKRIVKKYKKEK